MRLKSTEFTSKIIVKKAESSLGDVRECIYELLRRINLLEAHDKQLRYRLRKVERAGEKTPMKKVDEGEKTLMKNVEE